MVGKDKRHHLHNRKFIITKKVLTSENKVLTPRISSLALAPCNFKISCFASSALAEGKTFLFWFNLASGRNLPKQTMSEEECRNDPSGPRGTKRSRVSAPDDDSADGADSSDYDSMDEDQELLLEVWSVNF